MKIFSLLQVANSIRKTLSERYTSSFWVKAEMNKLNLYQYSGHCYPELVEKENGKVIAQMNGILWKTEYLKANKKFLEVLKEPLKDGIKILFLARITFDPAHGLALQILDIDPAFTLGDLEREKQETIGRLKNEGIYERNKKLPFPILPQRIAIISVETSKGYADFLSVIDGNPWKYKFFHFLFPSLLQGEKAVDGIIQQLRRIRKVTKHFDVVAIIRGGGGDVGLTCYNNYRLAKEIAEFPLPVITGIGHATNETVSEIIAHFNAITPTKLADFLIQKFQNVAVPVERAEEFIINFSRRAIADHQMMLRNEVRHFTSSAQKMLIRSNGMISAAGTSLQRQARFRCRTEHEKLGYAKVVTEKQALQHLSNQSQILERMIPVISKDVANLIRMQDAKIESARRQVELLDPKNVLKRGYSITLHNGKALTDATQINKNDKLLTMLYSGTVTSTVENTTVENERDQ